MNASNLRAVLGLSATALMMFVAFLLWGGAVAFFVLFAAVFVGTIASEIIEQIKDAIREKWP